MGIKYKIPCSPFISTSLQKVALTVSMSTISVGDTFSSYKELCAKLESFQRDNYVQLCRRHTLTIERARQHAPKRHFNDELVYSELKYCCVHGGRKYKSFSKGQYVIKSM